MSHTVDWIAEALEGLPPICTAVETYTVLRTTRRNLYRIVALGRLRAVKQADGGSSRLLIPRVELERYLRQLVERAAA